MKKPHRVTDLSGKTFYRLFVIEFAETRKANHYWLCKCECGSEVIVAGGNLKRGLTKSCGCFNKERASTRNGVSIKYPREYSCWKLMIYRCLDEDHHAYKNYGGRGITVCKEWLESFDNFYTDMGNMPIGMSLERKDNSKGYCKENCVWATMEDQAKNRRDNHVIEFQGQKMILADWAKKTGINKSTLSYRIKRGWTIERALTTPL